MSAHRCTHLSGLLVIFLFFAGCARESSAFTLDVEALRQLSPETAAGITYEENRATVYVTVIDKHGDAHRHRLIVGNVTRAQAIELLRQKKTELGRCQ